MEPKNKFLSRLEFIAFTGYCKTYYHEMNTDGQIVFDKDGMINTRASLELMLAKLSQKKKKGRNRILSLIEKLDELEPDGILLKKYQFANIAGLTHKYELDHILRKFKNSPKARGNAKCKFFRLEDVRVFIEENKLLPFSNYWAQAFIRREYLR